MKITIDAPSFSSSQILDMRVRLKRVKDHIEFTVNSEALKRGMVTQVVFMGGEKESPAFYFRYEPTAFRERELGFKIDEITEIKVSEPDGRPLVHINS